MDNPFIIKGPDGKAVFIGREDPTNPPVKKPAPCNHQNKETCTHMLCPICGGYFDYLLGEDTPDGGRRGCEKCYKPGKSKSQPDETTEEIIFD